MQKYNPSEIEAKWQAMWEKERIYSPNLDASTSLSTSKPFYNLMMFPYPSAEGMHVGNMYAFTGADVYGRFQRMQGLSVFEPIGLDGFGIHSENYAIKVGKHPVEQAKISEKNFYRQLKSIGNSFDWTRTVETYKPEYYKWTQWLFIQLFKAGLAYRKKAPVNFCPSCKTVLADEQVEEGLCERCNSVVEKRDLEQWFFKITKYADRLLNGLSQIDWAEKVKIAQKQWIGKSEGSLIEFKIQNSKFKIEVFTVYPETIYGVTYVVLAPEHDLISKITTKEREIEVLDYIKQAKSKSQIERTAKDKIKTGVFTGACGISPVNGDIFPIWIADYVLSGYGTGAVMGVPGSDHRDFAFAKKYKLPIIRVIGKTKEDKSPVVKEEDVLEEGILVNSDSFDGLKTPQEAREKIKDYLATKGFGKRVSQYHLRDWLISRQRYWGPPIPMIYCEKDNWQPVQEKDLPVELPYIKDYKPLGTGKAPLASHPEFYKTKCPKCGGEAKRETDVSDTFLDSAWYFLRYVSTDVETTAFDPERVKKWLPVNMYIGGAEHSVLHLLYSRFITMALKDLGFINFEEPFTKFRAHGLIVKDGAKMSKSKGNVVVPDAYIKKFGADSLRSYLMFMGPFSQGGDFRDTGIEGMSRFLNRVWRLISETTQINADKNQQISADNQRNQFMHKTIKKVTEDIEKLSYNTAIAALMEWYNFLSDQKSISREEVETFLKLLAPFAPHVSEELYQLLNEKKEFSSIHVSVWPKFDPKFLMKSESVVVVQINGKLRGNIKIKNEKLKIKNYVEDLAKTDPNVKSHLEGKSIMKVIYVEGKVINFVVNS